MQLGNNRVWDYVGDNFVHRLLQNKGDGKLVEGSPPGKQQVECNAFRSSMQCLAVILNLNLFGIP
jgi:hypothetical protein